MKTRLLHKLYVQMRYSVFVVLVILVAIVSSCARQEYIPIPEHKAQVYDETWDDILQSDLREKPITISSIESEELSRRNYFASELNYPFFATLFVGGPATFALLYNLSYIQGFGATFGILYIVVGPLYLMLGSIDLKFSETNLYKTELDSLNLAAIEEVLLGDGRLNYIKHRKAKDNDSIYTIDVSFEYGFIENNEKRLSGRRDKPHIITDWVIHSPENKKVAHIRTSNRFLVNERNVVHPRRTEFRNIYTELAHQSAESFIALLNGEDDLHVPSSPLGIRAKSDANVIASKFIGRSPFLADIWEYNAFIFEGLSRNQYLVNIDRGRTAGFDEGKSYRVLIPAKANDESAPDDNTGDNLNNALDISTESYWVIGWFEALLVEEDMSIGIIRLLRKYSNDVDYIFSDEIVRGYDFYLDGDLGPTQLPKRN